MEKNNYKEYFRRIKAQNSLIKNTKKTTDSVSLQLQCSCAHRDANGGISIDSPRNGEVNPITKGAVFHCRECLKPLDFSDMPQEEFERAIHTIDRLCDIGKMHLNFKNERDQNLLNDIAVYQYHTKTLMKNLYNACVKSKGKKKKKSKDSFYSNFG